MKKNLWVLIISIFLVLIGCSSFQDTKEYQDMWRATQKVMAQNNLLVKESLYREGTLVAVSQVNGDFLSKARVKVVARIVEDEEGYLEPAIRVISQWDNSDVQTWGRPDYQAGTRWINAGSNAAMEAKIYNEIQRELGRRNHYQGKAWKPSVAEKEQNVSDIIPSSTETTPAVEEQSLQEIP